MRLVLLSVILQQLSSSSLNAGLSSSWAVEEKNKKATSIKSNKGAALLTFLGDCPTAIILMN